MKFGLVIYGSIDTLTGGYLYDKQMTGYLTGSGHRVEILTLPERCYPLRPADNFANALVQRVADAGYDFLLQDELCHASLFLLNRFLRRRTPAHIVAVVHHLMCREPRSRMLNGLLAFPEKCYLDSVDGFIFNSPATRHEVFQLSPAQRPFVVAQPGGDRFKDRITTAQIEERTGEPGPLRLLYVGLVIERKGLLPLVHALARVPRDQWSLDVVGDTTSAPGYVRRIRQAIDTHGLASNVRFSGILSTEALAARFAGSHLLCMPFAYEGFGIVTLEALHFGVPVLGSTAGATPGIVQHGVNGLLFDCDDPGCVTAAVQALYADRRRLARMSTAAFDGTKRHDAWQETMQRIEYFLANFHNAVERP